jgi:SAM-dependent methyltransferase
LEDVTVPAITPREPTPFDDGPLYDAILGSLDYGLDFYLGLARAATWPVLDVACGTGRVLLPCLQAGVDVDGLDLFPGMIAQLQSKAAVLGLRPNVFEADMRSFRLARRYALIMIPFYAFVHCLTTDEQIASLVCCREHLLPGGMLAFDTFFPGKDIIIATDNTRVLELETTHPETGCPLRVFDIRSFDRVAQIQNSLMEIEVLDAAGNVTTTHRSRTAIRWIYKGEMELLLRVAGFDRWQISGGFDGRPLVNETDIMIVQTFTAGVN